MAIRGAPDPRLPSAPGPIPGHKGLTLTKSGRIEARTSRQLRSTKSATCTLDTLEEALAWLEWATRVRNSSRDSVVPSGIAAVPADVLGRSRPQRPIRTFGQLSSEWRRRRLFRHHNADTSRNGRRTGGLRDGTIMNDNASLKHLQQLDRIPFPELTADDVQSVVEAMVKAPVEVGTQKKVLWALRDIGKVAEPHEVPFGWPFASVKPVQPKLRRRSPRMKSGLSLAKMKAIALSMPGPERLAVYLLGLIGLRMAEMLGVCIGDLFSHGDRLWVHVQHQWRVVRIYDQEGRITGTEWRLTPVKTDASNRLLPLPHRLEGYVIDYLARYHPDVQVQDLPVRVGTPFDELVIAEAERRCVLAADVRSRRLVVGARPNVDKVGPGPCEPLAHDNFILHFARALRFHGLDPATCDLRIDRHHLRRTIGGYLARSSGILAHLGHPAAAIRLVGRLVSDWLGHERELRLDLPAELAAPVTDDVYAPMPDDLANALLSVADVIDAYTDVLIGGELGDLEPAPEDATDPLLRGDALPVLSRSDGWAPLTRACEIVDCSEQTLRYRVSKGSIRSKQGWLLEEHLEKPVMLVMMEDVVDAFAYELDVPSIAIGDAAKQLNVRPATVRAWARQGKLEARDVPGERGQRKKAITLRSLEQVPPTTRGRRPDSSS